jgi:hypothetical protein
MNLNELSRIVDSNVDSASPIPNVAYNDKYVLDRKGNWIPFVFSNIFEELSNSIDSRATTSEIKNQLKEVLNDKEYWNTDFLVNINNVNGVINVFLSDKKGTTLDDDLDKLVRAVDKGYVEAVDDRYTEDGEEYNKNYKFNETKLQDELREINSYIEIMDYSDDEIEIVIFGDQAFPNYENDENIQKKAEKEASENAKKVIELMNNHGYKLKEKMYEDGPVKGMFFVKR